MVLVWRKDGSLRFLTGNWTIRLSRLPTHYPALMRPSTACWGPDGSPHFTWSLGTGKMRWTRRANHWPHAQKGPLGFYECDRMPFGLTNAPATFQQLMETCLWDLSLNMCLIYQDDIHSALPVTKKNMWRFSFIIGGFLLRAMYL